jgi:hypothetical protein
VRKTSEATFRPPSGTRVPTGNAGASEPQPATNAAARSSWKRTISIESTTSSRPISSAMTANTSSCGACVATSVATRRSAACSSAKARTLSWALALEIAVATCSVKP